MDKITEKKLKIALLNLKEIYTFSTSDETKRIGELIYKSAQEITNSKDPENADINTIVSISGKGIKSLEKAAKEAEEYVKKRGIEKKDNSIKRSDNPNTSVYQSGIFKCNSDHKTCIDDPNQSNTGCWTMLLLCITQKFVNINIGGE